MHRYFWNPSDILLMCFVPTANYFQSGSVSVHSFHHSVRITGFHTLHAVIRNEVLVDIQNSTEITGYWTMLCARS